MSIDAIDGDVTPMSPAGVQTRSRHVRVVEVIVETHDSCSIRVEPSAEDVELFNYSPGQFLTVRIPDVGTGSARCYSLASSPHADATMTVTVKRVDGGHGSNWLCDTVAVGDELEVLPPGGTFGPRSLDDPVVLVAGGSGITPIISIAKSILFGGAGDVLLVYANRDERSVIFADELRELSDRFGERLNTIHLLESLQGYPTAEWLSRLLGPYSTRNVYVCGPGPLMDLTERVCADLGFAAGTVHSERFVSLQGNPFDQSEAEPVGDDAEHSVTVDLDGERRTVPWSARQKLLDALLAAGLDAPYSCREGACSACVCTLTSGEVRMARNEILADEDVADGYILACQAEPVSDEIAVEY